MKKSLCLLMLSSMIFLTSCSYAALKDDDEALNKGMAAADTKISGVIDKKVSPNDIKKKEEIDKKIDAEKNQIQKI